MTSQSLNCTLVFCLGFLGALAPEIYSLYEARWKRVKFSWWYFLVSTVYASLGGATALALPAVTYHGALYAGISMPVMIRTYAKHRFKPVALSNERQAPIQCSEPTRWQRLKELIQDHADGLF